LSRSNAVVVVVAVAVIINIISLSWPHDLYFALQINVAAACSRKKTILRMQLFTTTCKHVVATTDCWQA